MDVYKILDNVMAYTKQDFKIGFVGNGEPLLDIAALKGYLSYIENYPLIHVYTITNGTVELSDEDWMFLERHNVNVGFSLDGYKELHNLYRCNSYDRVIDNVENYKNVTGHYPTFNATVGKESIENADKVIEFFTRFGTRITFSRMIGKYGITLDQYRVFMSQAEKTLNVRHGGLDCTMYGGQCGAGINNFFYANGKVYLCGNCIDLPPIGDSSTPFEDLENRKLSFDRDKCYKEQI